ncbi:MAG: glycosyltransferase family 2 protein [Chitinophagaceae bacterium]|nr:glycosyltransferase family 2 protein [Chitinophagaceae bacterium]
MSHDLAVAWRIYPGVSKTPIIHSTDKFQLVKTCLLSFLKSTAGIRIRYYFILDGCPDSYHQLIQKLFGEQSYSVIKTDKIGNLATFALQVDILLKQSEAEIVYFAEDDYLYKPGQFGKMVNLVRECRDVDFVSCYFTPDIYNHPIHQHQRELKRFNDHLWISDSSTCMTFMTTKKTLQETKNVLLTYSKGNNDCALWLVLTKTHIYNPVRYLKYFMLKDKESFNIMKVAVKYSFRYFFSFSRYTLWIPYPGIGTHLEKGLVIDPQEWIDLAAGTGDAPGRS